MRIRPMFAGFAACVLLTCPAAARTETAGGAAVSAFTAMSLSDVELDAVTGMALGPGFQPTAMVLANNDAAVTAHQVNSISQSIVDNWSNDFASPLIFSNRLVAIGG